MARDAATLADPARCAPQFHQPIYTFEDDFRNYFSQVAVAPEDWWKTVAGHTRPHLDPEASPRFTFVSEYRLGFGIALNSNVCQRLANFIIWTLILSHSLIPPSLISDTPPRCTSGSLLSFLLSLSFPICEGAGYARPSFLLSGHSRGLAFLLCGDFPCPLMGFILCSNHGLT